MENDNICEDGALLLGYTAGTLGAEESAQVDRHLSGCARCREMVRENEEMIRVYRTVRIEAAHPSAEVLTQLAEGLSTPELSEARAHVDNCQECLEVVSVLARVDAEMEREEPAGKPRGETSRPGTTRLKDFWLLFPSWLASPVPAYVLLLLLAYPAYLGFVGMGGLETLEGPSLLVPPVTLESGAERGAEAPRLQIERSGEHRVVTFFVPIAPDRYRYQIELTRRGERIFINEDARSFDGIGTFALLLPEGALSAGSYTLRVEEVEKDGGEVANVIEFVFTLAN